jgi:hypothetical protein
MFATSMEALSDLASPKTPIAKMARAMINSSKM